MSRARQIISTLVASAFTLFLLGCSGSSTNSNAPQFNTATGQHPTNWLQNHWSEFAKNPSQCITCHGSTTDPLTAGGIAKVSCFTCHPNGPSHPTGWSVGLQHGRLGAQAAPGAKIGFAYCFKCHGNNISAGLTATSCLACHTKAPHPNKPWWNADPTKPNHNATNPANAPECIKCHANGANSSIKPTTPAPAGTAPGCFNNTLCHSKSI